jgi:hypothetical protein
MNDLPYGLKPLMTDGGKIELIERDTYRLSIPEGPGGRYRLAQMDNYEALKRMDFPHQTPFQLEVEARACAKVVPGTWGFGIWNNPFGMGTLAGKRSRWPALPNCAWFFFASSENYLTLRDDLPANGAMATTFSSPVWPAGLLALGAPVLGLMLIPTGRQLLRWIGRKIVRQKAVGLEEDPSEWHEYRLKWEKQRVDFYVDSEWTLGTNISPQGRLGLVIWIDNQYAALPPDGRFRYGTLPNPEPVWIEMRRLFLNR